MVVAKNRKLTKYTYAERVLVALFQIQREQRKRAVHIATLKVQVRKNAEARKDRLGPKWGQWVTKTVHTLSEQGVLRPGNTTGSMLLTPEAKTAANYARRQLRTPSTPVKADADEALWRGIVNQFSNARVTGDKWKRERRSRVETTGHNSGSESESEVDTPSPNKRRRDGSATRVERDRDSSDRDVYMRSPEEGRVEPQLGTPSTLTSLPSSSHSRPQNSEELSRTSSRTVISHVSKRPTPAPTEGEHTTPPPNSSPNPFQVGPSAPQVQGIFAEFESSTPTRGAALMSPWSVSRETGERDATEFLSDEEELRDQTKRLYRRVRTAERELINVRVELENVSRERDDLVESLAAQAAVTEALQAQLVDERQSAAAANAALQQQFHDLTTQAQDQKRSISSLQEIVRERESMLVTTRQELDQAQASVITLRQQIETGRIHLEEQESRQNEVISSLRATEHRLQFELESQIQQSQTKLHSLRVSLEEHESELHTGQVREADARQRLIAGNEQIANLQSALRSSEETTQRLILQQGNSDTSVKAMQDDLQGARSGRLVLEQDLKATREQLQHALETIDGLRTSNERRGSSIRDLRVIFAQFQSDQREALDSMAEKVAAHDDDQPYRSE